MFIFVISIQNSLAFETLGGSRNSFCTSIGSIICLLLILHEDTPPLSSSTTDSLCLYNRRFITYFVFFFVCGNHVVSLNRWFSTSLCVGDEVMFCVPFFRYYLVLWTPTGIVGAPQGLWTPHRDCGSPTGFVDTPQGLREPTWIVDTPQGLCEDYQHLATVGPG